jgi:hypothetical protein
MILEVEEETKRMESEEIDEIQTIESLMNLKYQSHPWITRINV